MSFLKKLAGQTVLYGLSSMVGRALNFLLVPFYTSVLLVSDFGVYTELYAYVAFLNIIYLFGMETAYFRFSNKKDENEIEVFKSIQTIIFFLSFLFSGFLILFSKEIANSLNYPGKSSYIIWLALILSVDAIVAIPFARLRNQNKASYFAFAKLFNIGLNIGLNLFFLVYCKNVYQSTESTFLSELIKSNYLPNHEITYIFIANFLSNLAMVPLLLKSFLDYRITWDFSKIKPLFLYAYPLMFMGLAGMTNEVIDRILLKPLLPVNFYNGLSSEEALGVYGGCYKLAMFMTLAIQSFRYAADPFFFSKAASKNAPELFAKVMNWFVFFCSLIFLGISLFAGEIGKVLLRNELFQMGITVVPVLLLANLFLGIYYNLSVWYKLTDKTYFGTWISIGGALFTVCGNIILIPIMGFMGAAITTLACYFFMTLTSLYWGQKHFPIPYDFFVVCSLILYSIFTIFLATIFTPESLIGSIFFRVILLISYLAFAYSLLRKGKVLN